MPAHYTRENTVTQYRAAKMLGVTPPAVNGYIKEGRLMLVNVDDQWRIPIQMVEEFNKPSCWKDIKHAALAALKGVLLEMQHGEPIDHDKFCGKVSKRLMTDTTIQKAIEQSTLRYREPATV